MYAVASSLLLFAINASSYTVILDFICCFVTSGDVVSIIYRAADG
jgi:hypothetical protein